MCDCVPKGMAGGFVAPWAAPRGVRRLFTAALPARSRVRQPLPGTLPRSQRSFYHAAERPPPPPPYARRACVRAQLSTSSSAAGADRAEQVAKDGDVVYVHFTAAVEPGAPFESTSRERPLSFRLGSADVLPGFHKALRGMKVGEKKHVKFAVEDAYGPRREENVMTLPRASVPKELQAGMTIPLSNGMDLKVLEVTDKSVTVDANPELAGKELHVDLEFVKVHDFSLPPLPAGRERAVFGAGCFWGVEEAFRKRPGVVHTTVGYAQGDAENPTYEEVCIGSTGHAEVVAVDFDAERVSYEQLLDDFWKKLGNSALTWQRAGADVGEQYRSGLYYLDERQRALAEASLRQREDALQQPVVTEIDALRNFNVAEDYHQQYIEKRRAAERQAAPTK